jgi:hypothetical protein
MNQAKCTTCGAGLTIKKGDKTTVCVYCQTTNIVENALALGKVEVDVTEDIKKLRANLTTFVQQNSIDEILRVSQKLLDWIPQDFVARYFFAYAKQQQNQPRFMYEFYQSPPTYTDDEINLVLSHINQHSDLRDKRRVLDFLASHHEDGISGYLKIHKEREDKENHYANVPRDVFVCYSSYNVGIAVRIVKELEADGNTCWISTRNLRPNDSENYWKNIENAIQNSTIVLVIGSEDSMRSKDVHQEIDFARQHQKKIIEFKIDEAPHNTLFKHVFNGIKWVKGSLDVNQNYTVLLERIYEERYQHPRLVEKDSVINPFIRSKDSYEEFVSIDDFKGFESSEFNIETKNKIENNVNPKYISKDSHGQTFDKLTEKIESTNNFDESIKPYVKSLTTKPFVWLIVLIGFITTGILILNFGLMNDVKFSDENEINIPSIQSEDSSINSIISSENNDSPDNTVENSITEEGNEALLQQGLKRTSETFLNEQIFDERIDRIVDSIMLSNGDVATLGYIGVSLKLSIFNIDDGLKSNMITISENFSGGYGDSLNLTTIKQISEDKLIVSYAVGWPISKLAFYVADLQGVSKEHRTFDLVKYNNEVSWQMDDRTVNKLYKENIIAGNIGAVDIIEDKIYMLTYVNSPSPEEPGISILYTLNNLFEVTNIDLEPNPDDLSFKNFKSSSYGEDLTFIGIQRNESFRIIDNIREEINIPTIIRLTEGGNPDYTIIFDSLFFLDGFFEGIINFGLITETLLVGADLFYIGIQYEPDPVDVGGYLPPKNYIGSHKNGRLSFEYNLNLMLGDLILQTGFSQLHVNGIFYDYLIEQIAIDLILYDNPHSSNLEHHRAFLSLDGILLETEKINWNNLLPLESHPIHSYEDGTILSTSRRGILIQRVKD